MLTMLSRRLDIQSLSAVSVASWGLQARAEQSCDVFTAATQATASPQAALTLLKEGNHRFTKGKTRNCDLLKQLMDTA